MAVKQTAGRDALGEFAPKFAELNDDVLFGEVWSREDQLSLRNRSLVTVIALMAQGLILFYVKNITYPITPSNADNSFLSKVVDSLAQTINHLF